MAYEIPVYLFVGFLEAGKTKFIQETMEDIQFDSGDKTLLLVCEEGEEEYDESKFAFGGTTVAVLEDKSQLNREHLEELAKKSGAGRVLIEYNGMWLMNDLYEALPDNWVVYQCLATADGTTTSTTEYVFKDGNLIRVSHCFAQEQALDLLNALKLEFPNMRYILEPTTALCSFYAEEGGLIMGFEGDFNTVNDNSKF